LRARASGEQGTRELIRRLSEGDADAWEEFVERYRRVVYGAIHRANARFGAGWDDIAMEEVFEDVLFKLLRRRGRALTSWRGRCKFETWIYRIVRNVCIDRIRKEARRAETGGLEDGGHAVAEGGFHLTDVDLRLSLEQSMERALSPREALAIRLIYFEGFTYRQAAAHLGMSIGAMSGFVYRALGKLRRDGGLDQISRSGRGDEGPMP